ncbi:hypothetical protein BSZ28_27300 [Pseudomonas moraviensis]|nr:hypothetical protein BSZ28_27300 [Pseudomonas moraviensis]
MVEHPFGNLKQWLFGNARFLLRQLEGARAEMALAVNAYNLKRAINVEMMVSRRSIVEHPFGNLKQWLFGNARFLLRQLEGARAEMALAVNAYNLKRAINVLGVRQMMALMG